MPSNIVLFVVLLLLTGTNGWLTAVGVRKVGTPLRMCATPPSAAPSSSPLRLLLSSDMKEAMKSKQKERLAAIRAIQTALKQVEVDERRVLDAPEELAIMAKLVKTRKESIASYTAAGRADLADVEQAEINCISTYMPQPLSSEKVEEMVSAAIAKVGAVSIKDMGRIMAELRGPLAGLADMADVGAKIKKRLTP